MRWRYGLVRKIKLEGKKSYIQYIIICNNFAITKMGIND